MCLSRRACSPCLRQHRNLKDPRSQQCHTKEYRPLDELPKSTVIIIFHNEARTTLLRTVWSVLDKSPPSLIDEILLIDDASDMAHLGDALTAEVATIPKVGARECAAGVGHGKADPGHRRGLSACRHALA